MNPREHLQYIRDLARRDGRYSPEAFVFISEAIGATAKWLQDGTISPNDAGPNRGGEGEFHVSGKELLTGIRRLALEKWGPLAPTVFRHWGVRRTEDFGEIVFCMVEDATLQWKRRDCDTRADFADGFDFDSSFNVI